MISHLGRGYCIGRSYCISTRRYSYPRTRGCLSHKQIHAQPQPTSFSIPARRNNPASHIDTRSPTIITTMTDDSNVQRNDLRSRSTTSMPQAVASIGVQRRYWLRSSADQFGPSTEKSEVVNVLYLPPEIVARILSYYCVHDEPVTLLPTRALVEQQNSAEMPVTPPFQSPQAPPINLLLVNKLFYDECIKQFYSQNAFTYLHGDHYNVWHYAGPSKRAHVRHIVLEALWELEVTFAEIGDTGERLAYLTVNKVWGRSSIWEALMEAGPEKPCYFPNLQSITQRVRCRWSTDWMWIDQNVPRDLYIDFSSDGTSFDRDTTVFVRRSGEDVDPLMHEQPRRATEKLIAESIRRLWTDVGQEAYLLKIGMSFMYSEIDRWGENAPFVPLLSLCTPEAEPSSTD